MEAEIKKTDFQRMTADQEKLVVDNMPLVHFLVRKCARIAGNYEDYVQAGCIGLILAAQRYDPGRGITFCTFASSYIRGAIHDQYSKFECSPLKLPRGTVYQDGSKPFPMCCSLHDAVEGADGLTVEGTLPDDNDDIGASVSEIALRETIAKLPDREKKIAQMLIEGKKQQQIADALGVSQPTVNRIIKKIGKAFRSD
jgi:RNA polymerase sigma factor (sigma-70 family)